MVTKTKKLGWYPWLTKPYQKFIIKYNQKTLHHAIIINSPSDMGINSLVWGISRWILCLHQINFKSCNKCHSCILMNSDNHPDWYSFPSIKKTVKIELDDVRSMVKKIMLTSHQNGAKIIWFSKPKLLTETIESCLLKIIEEPPKNTFFIVRIYKLDDISLTLRSRFILWNIETPIRNISLNWLKKQTNGSDVMIRTALNICNNIPISSKKFLNTSIWSLRLNLLKKLRIGIRNNDLFSLLPLLNKENVELLINWILLILIDIMKYKLTLEQYLLNTDHIEMIREMSQKFSYICLEKSIQSWIIFKDKLINIPHINVQLILLEQLIRWEKILHLDTSTHFYKR